MERRSDSRYAIGFKAELLYGDKSYAGFIENISEKGLHMIAYSLNTAAEFNLGTELEMKFQLSSGEVLDLLCEVKWSHKTPPHGLTFSIGVEISGPSPEWKNFLTSLSSGTRKPGVIISDKEMPFERPEKMIVPKRL